MPTDNSIVASLRKRLHDLEAEAAHVRRLLAEHGLGASAETAGTRGARDAVASAAREPPISDRWRPLYYLLAERGGDVHIDEMIAFAERNGFGFDAEAIRKQLETWTDQGLARASGPATFRLILFDGAGAPGGVPGAG